jgi:hypothetical protein
MFLKKGTCFFLFVTAVLLVANARGSFQCENLNTIRADGGAPPAPPIPWPSTAGAIDGPQLNADGGAPPAPPIPWPSSVSEQSILNADGGAPPAPPIPWGFASLSTKPLAV